MAPTPDPLAALAEFLPKGATVPPSVRKSHEAALKADDQAHLAARIAAIVEAEDADYERTARDADIAQALKVGPESFKPYFLTDPRPDVAAARAMRKSYQEARALAHRAAGQALAAEARKMEGLCEKVWIDYAGPISDDLTIKEARLIEATREEAKRAALAIILQLAALDSGTPAEAKVIREAARRGTLLTISQARRHISGADHREAEARRLRSREDAKAAENLKSATEASKARRGLLDGDIETEEGEES